MKDPVIYCMVGFWLSVLILVTPVAYRTIKKYIGMK
jgi:hypothetical protein